MGGGELQDIIDNSPTLEALIKEKLAAIPSDTDLTSQYIDPKERQDVTHRRQIEALLDACFEHSSVYQELSALAHARRNFSHDAERLDQGKQPELVLSPASKEAVIASGDSIKASRKQLILWLAVITLWNKQRDTKFASQTEVRELAAKETGKTQGSLKTELSNIRSSKRKGRFTEAERAHFKTLEADCRRLAQQFDNSISPFALLLPAAMALSTP